MNKNINVVGILLFLAGIFFLLKNIRMYFNPDSLKKYIETSPKTLLWRKKFGTEKIIKLSKLIFLPLGILISIVFIVVGFFNGVLPLIK